MITTPPTETPPVILIVDDDAVTRITIASALNSQGMETITASSGEECLTISKITRPDCILLDMGLPNIDGLTTCTRLKEDPKLHNTPIIFISSNDDTDNIIAGLNIGGHDYITKPIQLRIMLARVESAVREKRAREVVSRLLTEQQRELEMAASIQHSMLPSTNFSHQLHTTSWLYQPCFHMAGDIFNIMPLDEDHLALYVLDVTGHGLASALLSVQASRTLTSNLNDNSLLRQNELSRTLLLSPANVLSYLNAHFPMTPPAYLNFTLLYAVLNIQTGELTLSSAGHPGPVIIHTDGSSEQIQVSGVPIGMLPQSDYDTITITLQPGERIAFFSDGITEALDAQMLPFADTFHQILHDTGSLPQKEVIERIRSELAQWHAHQQQQDDVTLVLLDRPTKEAIAAHTAETNSSSST